MAWNDDSWKDSYDDWKLASPYDDEPEDDCDHTDYESDILTGIASCDRCGHRWMQSLEEIEAEHRRISAYQEYEERENRRQWWSDLFYNVRHPLQAIHWQMQKRGWLRRPAVTDDEIPF
jgi:hypothetical protein